MAVPVVTAFLRSEAEVLLVRRSDAVGTDAGLWGAISGHVADDGADPGSPERSPAEAVRAEIAEETGLLDDCDLVRAGDPLAVEDPDCGRTWRVHPFLFDCDSRAVATNEEVAEATWVPPTEILRRETVPGLWAAYDRVRPTVETVRGDGEHGSAYISVRALEVLRDRAGELAVAGDVPEDDARSELAALAADLLDARPSMAALGNRLDRAMAAATGENGDLPASDPAADWRLPEGVEHGTPAAVEAAARAAIEAALVADEGAAATAAERLSGTVLTLSRSGTVLAALRAADPDEVVVAESRPAREGVGVAETLAAEGAEATLVVDAAVAGRLAAGDVGAVVVGADTVLADGSVVNKVGTRAAALAAAREGVPVYVVAARDKVSPREDAPVETGDPAAVYDGDAGVRVENPTFDATPPDLVTAVLTEDGPLAPEEVRRVAEAHRELAGWQSSVGSG